MRVWTRSHTANPHSGESLLRLYRPFCRRAINLTPRAFPRSPRVSSSSTPRSHRPCRIRSSSFRRSPRRDRSSPVILARNPPRACLPFDFIRLSVTHASRCVSASGVCGVHRLRSHQRQFLAGLKPKALAFPGMTTNPPSLAESRLSPPAPATREYEQRSRIDRNPPAGL